MLSSTLKKVNIENKQLKYLTEKEMLDISIENADKVKDKLEFLKNYFKIEEKFDGTKLSIFRNDTPWDIDYNKNWVISFKNQILYSDEFENIDREHVKNYSVGISQYAFIHDHLKRIHHKTKEIKKNTEFFIEFIQNKLTTTRDYKNKHGLYLIASSPATSVIESGIIKTKPQGFFQDNNDEYSKVLDLNVPPIIFEGTLDSIDNITKGIKLDDLKHRWNTYKVDYENYPYETVKKLFLSFDSTLGGTPEGVVLYANDGNLYKFVQEDQYSKEVRFLKRDKYQADNETENLYWAKINDVCLDLLQVSQYDLDSLNYPSMLNELNISINNLTDDELETLFKFKVDKMIEQDKIGG